MTELKEQFAERFKQLIPINELGPKLQEQLLARAEIIECRKKRHIFKQGNRDNFSFYLLDGEIELLANDQTQNTIVGGSEQANYAMAQLQPRQFSAIAKTKVTILQVDRNALDQLLVMVDRTETFTDEVSTMEVDEVDGLDDDTDWMTKMLQSEIFSKMPTANMHQLFAALESIEMKAGDAIIKQGEVGEHYHIIESGRCAVLRKPTPTAKDVKLAELGPGDSFGEEALVSEAKRNATVTMLTDGSVMRLSKDDFIDLIQKPTLSSVTFDQAVQLQSSGAVWLDIRYPNEHKASSIDGSMNIPLNSIRLQTEKLDQEKKYILYCDTGGRSSTATFLLAERGYDVCYLEGGLVNNPDALPGEMTTPPKKPEPIKEKSKEDDEDVDATVHAAMIDADLETTTIKIAKAKQATESADAETKKKQQAIAKQLEQERKKLETEKKAAEKGAQQKAAAEEKRLQQLKAKAKKSLQEEQKKLDDVYAKNAAEMEKLQKLKEESEKKLKEERARIEMEAEEARKKLGEADELKKQLEESRRLLEEQAEKRKQEQEEMERRVQAEARTKIEEEKKKLAEQYERNSQEFEKLQKAKTAAAAAKQAAKQEAQKIIEEFKSSHEKTRAAEEEKLRQERLKLEEEAKKIQVTLKQIQKTKAEAEAARKEAIEEANQLKQKQKVDTQPDFSLEKLQSELDAVEEKIGQADRDLEDANHAEKVAESARDEIDHDMVKQKKQEEALAAQIANDLDDWEDQQAEDALSVSQVQSQAELMRRIKEKAEAAIKAAQGSNADLLSDISKQLGNGD